jgi:hypothetical protein
MFRAQTRFILGCEKNKNLTLYRCIVYVYSVRNLSFLYLPKYDVFWAEISVVPVDCLYVCAYLISIFPGVVEIQKNLQ